MKVIFSDAFYQSYTYDPAAAQGRMEAVMDVIRGKVTLVQALPASEEDIAACHTKFHMEDIRRMGIYDVAAIAAGGAIQAAETGMSEPCFGLIRPPGHHASSNSSWGFCFFNNMAIAIEKLKREGKIEKAHVLDIDLHFGDGTVNILQPKGYVSHSQPEFQCPGDLPRAGEEKHTGGRGRDRDLRGFRQSQGGLGPGPLNRQLPRDRPYCEGGERAAEVRLLCHP